MRVVWPRHPETAVFALFLLLTSLPIQAGDRSKKTIQSGDKVTIEYTLVLADGQTVFSNAGKDPLQFVQGQREVLPALEEALVGLTVDDAREVTLSPEDAYGPLDPGAFREVEPDRVPESARTTGARLIGVTPTGERLLFHVHEIHDDRIILDLNHPLAGQTVTFRVKVLSVE